MPEASGPARPQPSDSDPPSAAAGPDYLDQAWLRGLLTALCEIDRPSASEGETRAARWLAEKLAAEGIDGRLEAERAHGTYWWPLGVGVAAGAVAGIASLRARSSAGRVFGAALAGAAAAGIASEYPPGPRWIRSALPQHETMNVIAELGPADADRTVVVVAHHDAAHAGLLFHPGIPATISKAFPALWDRANTSPPMMFPILGGPAAVALGSAIGSRKLTALGTLLSAGALPVFADIAARQTVPGANDNGTAVVLLIALARALTADPTTSTRVLLVSTGSEESFSEGMKAFGERHFAHLPKDRTFFFCVDTVGSPHLMVLRGEGFLRMYHYPENAISLVEGEAERLGIWMYPDLRFRNGTDGLESLAAGYPTVALGSVTDYKVPSDYHWPTDTADRVDYGTLADAVRLVEATIRSLDREWLARS